MNWDKAVRWLRIQIWVERFVKLTAAAGLVRVFVFLWQDRYVRAVVLAALLLTLALAYRALPPLFDFRISDSREDDDQP